MDDWMLTPEDLAEYERLHGKAAAATVKRVSAIAAR